eukprot:s365_g25.t2
MKFRFVSSDATLPGSVTSVAPSGQEGPSRDHCGARAGSLSACRLQTWRSRGLRSSAMAAGQTSSTYSFSSAPKAVTRKKYREPGDVEPGLYRNVKETCISWDKRVHRGNTYSMYTQNAIKEAIETAQKQQAEKKGSHTRNHYRNLDIIPGSQGSQEPSIFDMPLPEHERVAVDLTKHLVANEQPPQMEVMESQTDEFLPEPPQEQYQPQRTGIDACTQVEDGELFDFDREVEPILDVLVMKTLEQSIMEVEEEHELAAMSQFKSAWYERQRAYPAAWREQVEEEWVRWHEKELVLTKARAQKEKDARLRLKIQAVNIAREHLSTLVPDAKTYLKELAFPDPDDLDIQRHFLPSLFQKVEQEVSAMKQAQSQIDALAAECVAKQQVWGSPPGQATWEASLQQQRAKSAELQKLHLEELQPLGMDS